MIIEKEHFTVEGEEDCVRFIITEGANNKTVFLNFEDVTDLTDFLNRWMCK